MTFRLIDTKILVSLQHQASPWPADMYDSIVHIKKEKMQIIPFSQARAQLANALRSVEAGHEPFSISRRGQVAGVLMSYEQYQRMGGAATGFAEKLKQWRAEQLTTPGGTSEDDPFANLRQTDTAREFSW